MALSKSVQRNPLIPIIEGICRSNGFKFRIEPGGNHHTVYIVGIHNGKTAELKYPFPRICESFRSAPNFKAKFARFVQEYTKEIGFLSPDPHYHQEVIPERKSTFVQKLNLEKPKKVLATPKTLLTAIQRDELPVMIAPYIPNTYTGDTVRSKPVANEPVSDTMALAMFIVPLKDLSLMVELFAGTGRFKGSKPAPLRILNPEELGTPQPHTPTPPPMPPIAPPVEREEPAKKPPMNNVIQISEERLKKGRISAMTAIAERIHTDIEKVWSSTDFLDLMTKKNSIQATLSLLTTAKKIKRTAPDRYVAIPEKKKARK